MCNKCLYTRVMVMFNDPSGILYLSSSSVRTSQCR